MKKLIPLSLVLLVISFVSCSKDEPDNGESNQERIERILAEQAPVLKKFAEEHIPGAELDTETGIWYKIQQAGTDGSVDYNLSKTNVGLIVAPPYAEVKYKGQLIDEAGTVFDETEEDKTAVINLNQVILAWTAAFWPTELEYNLDIYKLGGVTEKGLQKGAIIEFVAPSPYCYDNRTSAKIPADSPLHFTIEVVDVRNTQKVEEDK